MATIQIKGEGKAYGKVNEVTLTVTVKRTHADGAQAVSAVNERVKEMRNALRAAGFDGEDFKTNGLWVNEEYENLSNGGAYTRKRNGFACREQLSFTFPYTAERLENAVSALSGEELSFSFSVAESGELKKTALANAYRNALSDAEVLAQASGRALGNLLAVSNIQGGEGGALRLTREAAVPLAASAVELNLTDVGFYACVTVEWELI